MNVLISVFAGLGVGTSITAGIIYWSKLCRFDRFVLSQTGIGLVSGIVLFGAWLAWSIWLIRVAPSLSAQVPNTITSYVVHYNIVLTIALSFFTALFLIVTIVHRRRTQKTRLDKRRVRAFV